MNLMEYKPTCDVKTIDNVNCPSTAEYRGDLECDLCDSCYKTFKQIKENKNARSGNGILRTQI